MKGADPVRPGEILTPDGTIELGPGRDRVALTVENAGDRPIQVGSHYHFAAANPALSFDRDAEGTADLVITGAVVLDHWSAIT